MTIAAKILDAVMETQQPGEWQSITLNITAGPNEGPVVFAAVLPGTTAENAKRIQKDFIVNGAKANE